MAKKGKADKKKRKGNSKKEKKAQEKPEVPALTAEELKILERKKQYWNEMHRQAIFLDMSHNINRPWTTTYYHVIPCLIYGIPIGPKGDGDGKKKGKGKGKKMKKK